MLKNRKQFLKFAILMFININSLAFRGFASEGQVEKLLGNKIAREKGTLKPGEILVWKDNSKSIPKDWLTLENKHFSVNYPKCIAIQGDGGEDNPKIAPYVNFRRTSECSNNEKLNGDENLLSIGIDYLAGFRGPSDASTSEPSLLKQKITINGNEGMFFAGLMNFQDESKKIYQAQLRWQIFFFCNKKTYHVIVQFPPGEPTMQRVNKSDYSFPEDFKQIVSTFKCK